jgi:peptidoglycan/LPS O-acetylase OafA/YrhL
MATTVGGEPAPVIAAQHVDEATSTSGRARVLAYLEPNRGGRFASLDGFRAIAALGVVVYHVAGYQQQTGADTIAARFLNNLGNYGVATFFLLSGFLLYRPFVIRWFRDEPAPDPLVYIRHRFLRIFPAYWLALGAFIAFGLIQAKNPGADFYFTLFSLTQIYRNSFGFAGLTVAWTLCIEVSFYLALPLIAALIRLIGTQARTVRMKLEAQLIGLGCLYLVSLGYRGMFAGPWSFDTKLHPGWTGHMWLPNYFDWFALGMLLAVCVCWTDMGRHLPLIFQRLANTGWACWHAAGACSFTLRMLRPAGEAGAGGAAKEDTTQMFVRFFLNGLAAFFFLLPGIIGRRRDSLINRGLSSIVPMYLGTISYGVYLWHKVWIDYLKGQDKVPNKYNFAVMLLTVVGLAVVSASASYYFLERPMMAFKDSRRLRSRAKPTVPA